MALKSIQLKSWNDLVKAEESDWLLNADGNHIDQSEHGLHNGAPNGGENLMHSGHNGINGHDVISNGYLVEKQWYM